MLLVAAVVGVTSPVAAQGFGVIYTTGPTDPKTACLWIDSVASGAYYDGLRVGDAIVSVNGVSIGPVTYPKRFVETGYLADPAPDSLVDVLEQAAGADTLNIVVWRDGKILTISLRR